MKTERVPLSLAELHQLKWLQGGVLILLSFATISYLDVNAWPLALFAGAAVIAALIWPSLVGRIPRWAHALAFPLIVAGFAADLWITREILPAMVRLDVLLLGYRGIAFRQKRDDLQVIVLGLFLVVVAGVLTVSLAFAAQILAFVAGALLFLLTVTITEAAEAGSPSRGPAAVKHLAQVNWRRLLAHVARSTDWRVLALGSGLFVGVVAVSALLFLAIPRFQLENSLFLDRLISKKARTGFNEMIQFGDVTELQQDTRIALSVDIPDRSQVPATPYWRMLVLDDYRNGTFRLSPSLRAVIFGAQRADIGMRSPLNDQTGRIQATFYFESGVSRYLPLLGSFATLSFRERQRFRAGPRWGLVMLRDEPVTMTAYRVWGMSSQQSTREAATQNESASRPQSPGEPANRGVTVTGLAEADLTALKAVVTDLKKETPSSDAAFAIGAAEFSARAEAWLWRKHAYALKLDIPSGTGDPLVRWLASNNPGTCELFAGSFVLLARAAGFPARVVTGFKGGTWNGYSNNFTVRNSDAHAWCEIYDASSRRWLRADPTPGSSAASDDVKGEAAIAARTDRSWTARFDSLRVFWYRRIVNFDQRSQVEALESAQNGAQRLREWLVTRGDALKAWARSPFAGGRGLRLALALGGVAVAVWCLRRFRFSATRLRLMKRSSVDPIRAEASRWRRKLLATGRGFVDVELMADLDRLRFGDPGTWGAPAEVFRRARVARRRGFHPPPVAAD